MSGLAGRLPEVRIEIVTSAFVASGVPEGIHDLGRLLENLNNPAISRHIELRSPAVRPLYRAQAHVELDAPLLVRRDEVVFANFEGPYFTRGIVRGAEADVPVLLMAPPFQLQGIVPMPPAADRTQALRTMAQGFFLVRNARVFDSDGNDLGEGEQIVVNGAMVQMTSATRRRIDAPVSKVTSIEQEEREEPRKLRRARAA